MQKKWAGTAQASASTDLLGVTDEEQQVAKQGHTALADTPVIAEIVSATSQEATIRLKQRFD